MNAASLLQQYQSGEHHSLEARQGIHQLMLIVCKLHWAISFRSGRAPPSDHTWALTSADAQAIRLVRLAALVNRAKSLKHCSREYDGEAASRLLEELRQLILGMRDDPVRK